tara:strand:- start:3650 stop:3862 length:213 start_codon:yes stop_codon:yes gene_type:complete
MAKITLDEIEYDTEDFTEKEVAMLNEIQFNGSIKQQLEYQWRCVSNVGNSLVKELKASLESSSEPDNEAA